MYLTIMSVALGGVVSWLITHAYYKFALKKAASADPNRHIEAISTQLQELRSQLRDHDLLPRDSQRLLDQMTKNVRVLAHTIRQSLQGLFFDVGHAKLLLGKGDAEAAKRSLSDIELHMGMMKLDIAGRLKDDSASSLPERGSLEGKRVLIVEDDCELAQRLAEILSTRHANQVDTAGSISEGLSHLLNSAPYDLLVLDMMLPETPQDHARIREAQLSREQELLALVDGEPSIESRWRLEAGSDEIERLISSDGGFVLLERYKKLAPNGRSLPPVLFLSARSNREVGTRGFDLAGRAAWLVKPVGIDELVRTAARLLARAARDSTEVPSNRPLPQDLGPAKVQEISDGGSSEPNRKNDNWEG